MTKDDEILLKQFFDEYAVKQLPADDFSQRVVRALPSRRQKYALWLLLAVAIIVGLVYLRVPQQCLAFAIDTVVNAGVALFTLHVSLQTVLSIIVSVLACYYVFVREMLEKSKMESF